MDSPPRGEAEDSGAASAGDEFRQGAAAVVVVVVVGGGGELAVEELEHAVEALVGGVDGCGGGRNGVVFVVGRGKVHAGVRVVVASEGGR